MKRSEINSAFRAASACFQVGGWTLPPHPKWDITDLGLGRFAEFGLVLINLAEEPEYCEKLMYSRHRQVTPLHTHKKKKEDIICRQGRLAVEVWAGHPKHTAPGTPVRLKQTGEWREFGSGDIVVLEAGERVTLTPGIYHAFWPESDECIIGEVSTANDDAHDNFFVSEEIGRFPQIEEDEPSLVRLLSER